MNAISSQENVITRWQFDICLNNCLQTFDEKGDISPKTMLVLPKKILRDAKTALTAFKTHSKRLYQDLTNKPTIEKIHQLATNLQLNLSRLKPETSSGPTYQTKKNASPIEIETARNELAAASHKQAVAAQDIQNLCDAVIFLHKTIMPSPIVPTPATQYYNNNSFLFSNTPNTTSFTYSQTHTLHPTVSSSPTTHLLAPTILLSPPTSPNTTSSTYHQQPVPSTVLFSPVENLLPPAKPLFPPNTPNTTSSPYPQTHTFPSTVSSSPANTSNTSQISSGLNPNAPLFTPNPEQTIPASSPNTPTTSFPSTASSSPANTSNTSQISSSLNPNAKSFTPNPEQTIPSSSPYPQHPAPTLQPPSSPAKCAIGKVNGILYLQPNLLKCGCCDLDSIYNLIYYSVGAVI